MAHSGARTYVGFGFGAIQAGLFLYEAHQTGTFGRLVVAEVLPEVVADVQRAGGCFAVNIAHRDRIEQAAVGPVEIYNPLDEADRARLIDALAGADEIGTAIPGVTHYVNAAPGSLHHVLAAGLRRRAASADARAVVYAAENHNHAAEKLQEAVYSAIPAEEQARVRARVRFVNTVIGKMSGVVANPGQIALQNLTPVTPGAERAFLVESFNRILIEQVRFGGGAPFERGLAVFEEKADLLPFEEAKLYGHNATHALAAYLGALRGVAYIADLRGVAGVPDFLRAAFIEESGAALIRKYRGVDALFTPEGYARYADDLLERMMNPFLRDTVQRVGRDPRRKLGWDDRLIGTMRVALGQGVTPRRYALGAAAALATLDAAQPPDELLRSIWAESSPAPDEARQVITLIEEGRRRLRAWVDAGFPDAGVLFRG